MGQFQIAVMVGSLRSNSINRQLAHGIERLAPAELAFQHLELQDLPLFNQDNENKPPESVKQLKAQIAASDGLLFVAPEYNRSVPGVLKNAIDHGSRPYGKGVFSGKPAGVLGASGGVIGTALAQQHLRNILSYLDVPTLGQPEAFIHAKEGLFDADGRIGPDSRQFLQSWVDRFAAWIKLHAHH
jgi:chromate reductase